MQNDSIAECSCRKFQQHYWSAFCNHLMSIYMCMCMLYSVFSNMTFNTLTTGECLMQLDIIAGSLCRKFQQNYCVAFSTTVLSLHVYMYSLYSRACVFKIRYSVIRGVILTGGLLLNAARYHC